MSEAPTNNDAQVLFPDGGANADPADPTSANLMPLGDQDANANPNPDPQEGGADTQPGNDSTAGPESESGQESVAGESESSPDALTADSYDIKLSDELTGNDALISSAKTLFAEVGVQPDQAQKLVDFYTEALKTQATEQQAAWNAEQSAWKTEIEAMPEFKGPTRDTSLQSIAKLFDEFGDDNARAALNAYGTGNNPALVRMFLKMANVLNEAAPTPQGRPVGLDRNGRPISGRTIGETLFGDTPENNSIMVRNQ